MSLRWKPLHEIVEFLPTGVRLSDAPKGSLPETLSTMRIATLISIALLVALPASAQSNTGKDRRGFSLGGGIGFVASPDAFELGFEAPYHFDDHFSLGPVLQLGLDGNFLLVLASANARYGWRMSQIAGTSDDWAKRLKLYGQGGLGVSHLSIDIPSVIPGGGSIGDTAFLVNFGFGLEYDLNSKIALTSNMLFNFHVGDLFADNFTYSWQMLGARYRF